MIKYAIEIFYSEDDGGYIAVVPGLPGCSAFGNSEEEALHEVKVSIDLWLATSQSIGREIPQPHGREMLRHLLFEDISYDAASCE
jgi:predicted RNase H-like HicB family nuclease